MILACSSEQIQSKVVLIFKSDHSNFWHDQDTWQIKLQNKSYYDSGLKINVTSVRVVLPVTAVLAISSRKMVPL